MKRLYILIVFFFSFLHSSASITTTFSVNNVVDDTDKFVYLHSLEILNNCTVISIKIVPKKDFKRLNIWISDNTIIKADELELPILGLEISKKGDEIIFSSEAFNGKWELYNLKEGKSYYYRMAFEGVIPPGVFKISLIDNGTERGYHGYIFRDQFINNTTLKSYDFKSEPLKSTYFTNSKTLQSSDNTYTASLYSIKIFSNYTTATIKLIPNQDINELTLYQSENTVLLADGYKRPIQGFLGDFDENNDSTLYSSPFNGSWKWVNAKAGIEYLYTIVFDGTINYGIEKISIIDNANEKGRTGFSFLNITIDNPVPFDLSNLDDYLIYQFNNIKDYILNQNTFLKWLYLTLSLIVALLLFKLFTYVVKVIISWLWSTFTKRLNNRKPRKKNINEILKERDKPIFVKVFSTSEYKTLKLIKKTRFFNGRYIQYYSTGEFFSRVYLHPGDYLYKIVLSFIEIKERCKSSSIKAAFSECPGLLDQLNRFVKGENSDWVYVKWIDGQETICLRNMFLFYEIGAYKRGQDSLKNIIAEVHKINTSLLKEKLTFAKFLRKSSKWIIRGGVKLLAAAAAGYIGANLPDFDFDFDVDVDVPDLDVPDLANFDVPDYDNDPNIGDENIDELSYDDSMQNGSDESNVSFKGSSDKEITVHQEGNSSKTTTVTAKKVPGTSNTWDIYKGNTYVTRLNGIVHGSFNLDGFGKAKF